MFELSSNPQMDALFPPVSASMCEVQLAEIETIFTMLTVDLCTMSTLHDYLVQRRNQLRAAAPSRSGRPPAATAPRQP